MMETDNASVENTEATAEVEATTVGHEGETVSETTYVNGKFKSVGELEKSYSELQSTFSKKTQEYNDKVATSGSPEEYTLDEGTEVTPRLEALMNKGKEIGLNDKAFKELMSADVEATKHMQEQYVSEQKEALGKEADNRLKNVSDWLEANTGDSAQAMKDSMTSAKAIEGMESIIKQLQGTTPAQVKAQPTVNIDSLKAMRYARDEFGGRRMESDPSYAARVTSMEAEFIENGGSLV